MGQDEFVASDGDDELGEDEEGDEMSEGDFQHDQDELEEQALAAYQQHSQQGSFGHYQGDDQSDTSDQ